MSREEAIERICRQLRMSGDSVVPRIARGAGVARSVAYSVCDELLESGEIVRRRDGHVWRYRLVWQDEPGAFRSIMRLCRVHGIDARRDRWNEQLRVRAPHPSPGVRGMVWLDTTDDVAVYLVDRGSPG